MSRPTHCDICGIDVRKSNVKLDERYHVKVSRYRYFGYPLFWRSEELDICSDCISEIREQVRRKRGEG